MLKRMLNRGIKATRQWLQEDPNGSQDYEQDDFAYPWLNSIFTKLVNEGVGKGKPMYAWGTIHGVHLAKAIGIDRVSVIEFGVAGGNGLISLERIAEKVEQVFGVGIDVYGFDTGEGLPKPQDYRDLPNLYRQGSYPMDFERLKNRLQKAQLHLGLIDSTIPKFITSRPAPVAFISVDVDYYSSTMHALKILEADQALLLPRIHCYFDDFIGFTFSEYSGERLAIAEFNAAHSMRKLSPIFGLKYFLPEKHANASWTDQLFLAHIFDHVSYGSNDGLVKRYMRSNQDLNEE